MKPAEGQGFTPDLSHPSRDLIDTWRAAVEDPQTLYRLAKLIDGYAGEGSWLLCAARAQVFFGLVRRQFFYEPLRSYDEVLVATQWAARLRDLYVPEHTIDHVAISFHMYDSAYTAPKGVLPMPGAADPYRGGHAVAVVGWDDYGESLVIRNSWGSRWGDGGYGVISRTYLDRFLIDAWLSRDARYGSTRQKWHRFSGDDAAFRSAHLLENPRWRFPVQYAGQRYMLVNYETLSTGHGSPADIIELRNRNGVRVAWAVLLHLRASSAEAATTLLTDFYVWPPFRRRGYGTILDAAAVIRAAAWGSAVLKVPLYEPDSRPATRGPGRRFALARGYAWTWRRELRPSTAGYATKAVARVEADAVLRPARTGYAAHTSRACPRRILGSR